jgi:CheY-like chemotaxis protein
VTRKRVLLVAASSSAGRLIGERLRCHDLVEEVDLVADVDEAIDYLLRRAGYAHRATAEAALVLLDLAPDEDPRRSIQRIKSDPRTKSIPVVVLTAPTRAGDSAAVYDLGANACVVKPSHSGALDDAVAEIAAFWLGVNRPPP